MKRRGIFLFFCLSALTACEVEILDPAVQRPAQQAALNAAAGQVPGGQVVQEGKPINVHLTDGGYVGGDPNDMNSHSPLALFACNTSSCAKPQGADFGVTDCSRNGDSLICRERGDNGAPDVGRFVFYGDQRVSVENNQKGSFYSGVWHQTPAQKSRAEQLYPTMMAAFEATFTETYARESDRRYAPVAALEEIGAAAMGLPTARPTSGTGDTGTDTLIAANRQVTVRDGYNIGNHSIEVQSRRKAADYTCESAQRIAPPSGAACTSFRALVIIEACTPGTVPPAAYNQDQPEFLRVAAAFANEGADLTNACF